MTLKAICNRNARGIHPEARKFLNTVKTFYERLNGLTKEIYVYQNEIPSLTKPQVMQIRKKLQNYELALTRLENRGKEYFEGFSGENPYDNFPKEQMYTNQVIRSAHTLHYCYRRIMTYDEFLKKHYERIS